jgi:predicted ATPase
MFEGLLGAPWCAAIHLCLEDVLFYLLADTIPSTRCVVLDRVSFKNFRSLKAVTIDLAPLTVLVGPNGSGKSSVLRGICRLIQASDASPPRNTGRRTGATYLHLEATALRRASKTDEEEPRMAQDGHGLASMLTWLAGAMPAVLHGIAIDLARVIPGVRRILVHREQVMDQASDEFAIHGHPVERSPFWDRFSIELDNGIEVPADLLSEGTVLALGLLTKLHEPERSRVLLLDDIDRCLHIDAQAKLIAVLRDLMRLDPDLQIVCTTHSAYLLDLFEPSEVRVLDLDESRATHAKPLTAHPEFEKWRFGTQTGELWVALGDAWVTKQPE